MANLKLSEDCDSESDKIKVLVVDDHPLMRESIINHLVGQSDIKVIGEANDGEEAVRMASELNPDIIIMDIGMPKMNGLEATRIIKKNHPEIIVLVLTVHEDAEYILKILEAGAAGYLIKNILGDKLSLAIRLVIDGESVLSDEITNTLLKYALQYPPKITVPIVGDRLTTRELEIFRLGARGMSNKQICQELNLNLRTVKSHFVNIFSKLNVSSRTEAVVVGLRIGLVSLDDISR